MAPETIDVLRSALPLPRIEDARRILCVQPHPDDVDIGVGAAIAKLARLGVEVVYLTVTDESVGTLDRGLTPSSLAALRREEQEKAARVLGVKEVRWLGYPDAGDYSEHAVRQDVIRTIRQLRPDLVVTVDPNLPYESHPDHLRCGRATAAAVLLYNFPHIRTDPAVDEAFTPYAMKGIAYFHTAHPNAYVAVGEEDWQRRFEAIACHQSQVDGPTLELYKFYFDLKAREYGATAGCERAEAFRVLTPQMMHCFVDAARI
ncbi:MAG: PIG-L family deacetylase [Limnochordaceae bacterium]|nr:PIG-L family deacetylase [Limnochordaceae bacterium]